MPSRKQALVNGSYYHIFNRGVNHTPIFLNSLDYKRFLKSLVYYQINGPKPRYSLFTPTTLTLNSSDKIVEIVGYCLMPNHFHLLLYQVKNGGISEFLSKISNSYTKYFNIKHKRVGPLFQGEFKSVYIESNEQLLHLSRYIHLNPLVSNLTDNLDNFPWSSYPEYMNRSPRQFCAKNIILDQFSHREGYEQFVLDQAKYGQELELIKHQLLD